LRTVRLLGTLLLGLTLCSARSPALAATVAGWERWQLDSTYAWRYVPSALAALENAPVVVFFHGAGSNPDSWRPTLASAAESAGVIVLAPKSRGFSWTLGLDDSVLGELRSRLREQTSYDAARFVLAGHSAGGVMAYWLGYARFSGASAVVEWSAPYYPIAALADPGYRPPMRMLYGTLDPNYVTAFPRLKAQWQRLGVPSAEAVFEGLGHSGIGAAPIGEAWSAAKALRYPGASAGCEPKADVRCLGGGRFEVRVRRLIGPAALPLTAMVYTVADSAVFSEGPASLVLVRLVDGCASNGHWWLLASAAESAEIEVLVSDASTRTARVFTRPAGSSNAIVAQQAFACTP
jgi:poly(3-hydroxybutyrate) depolymerase